MIRRSISISLGTTFAALSLSLLTSCSVDENAAFETSAAATGSKTKKTEVKTDSAPLSWSDKVKADQEVRNAEKAQAAAEKAKLAAAKAKEEAAATKKLEATRKAEDAAKAKADLAEQQRLAAEKKGAAAKKGEELALAEKKASEKAVREAAEKKAREEALTARNMEREAVKVAKLEAKKKAEQERALREASEEVAALATENSGGGFFSRLSIGTSAKQYKSEGHEIFVNHMLLPTLTPSNAKIEISLGEQRARVFRKEGGQKVLIIETQISSGKSGHSTSPGTFHIKEKLVQKQSTLYGRWVSTSGETVGSSGESGARPSGGSRFVGADMPYWMRINGGIGMHVGYVPDYPASHGCIRVPASIQPLIFSKVGVGTSVTISH